MGLFSVLKNKFQKNNKNEEYEKQNLENILKKVKNRGDIILNDINNLLNDLDKYKINLINENMYNLYKKELEELKYRWVSEISSLNAINQNYELKTNIIFRTVNLRTKLDNYMHEIGNSELIKYFIEIINKTLNELLNNIKNKSLKETKEELDKILTYINNEELINDNIKIKELYNKTKYEVYKYYYVENKLNEKIYQNEIISNIELFKDFILSDIFTFLNNCVTSKKQDLKNKINLIIAFEDINNINTLQNLFALINGYTKFKTEYEYKEYIYNQNNDINITKFINDIKILKLIDEYRYNYFLDQAIAVKLNKIELEVVIKEFNTYMEKYGIPALYGSQINTLKSRIEQIKFKSFSDNEIINKDKCLKQFLEVKSLIENSEYLRNALNNDLINFELYVKIYRFYSNDENDYLKFKDLIIRDANEVLQANFEDKNNIKDKIVYTLNQEINILNLIKLASYVSYYQNIFRVQKNVLVNSETKTMPAINLMKFYLEKHNEDLENKEAIAALEFNVYDTLFASTEASSIIKISHSDRFNLILKTSKEIKKGKIISHSEPGMRLIDLCKYDIAIGETIDINNLLFHKLFYLSDYICVCDNISYLKNNDHCRSILEEKGFIIDIKDGNTRYRTHIPNLTIQNFCLGILVDKYLSIINKKSLFKKIEYIMLELEFDNINTKKLMVETAIKKEYLFTIDIDEFFEAIDVYFKLVKEYYRILKMVDLDYTINEENEIDLIRKKKI